MSECGGKPDGTPCGNPADSACDHADTCQAGMCVQNIAAANTACGDGSSGECDRADTCDGAGTCQTNHVAAATACGDATESDCDHADTCDGAGACQPNHVAAATACGDGSTSECDQPDTCDGAGACQPNYVAATTACGDASTTECDQADTCDGAGACQPNYVAANTACGDASLSECNLADTCNGAGACQPNYVAANTACGDSSATDCDLADTCDGAGACGDNTVLAGTACYDCAAGPGRCAECSAGASCDDGPACVQPGVAANLASTMSAGNNHRGNMFDITAVNTIVITSFDAHPMGNTTIEVYYRPGSYAGSETNSAAWTFIGSAAVTAQPFGTPTPVPVPVNVTIPAGQTYAFYVTSNDTTIGLNYSNGSNEGGVYSSDANLQFREGVGLEYPFTAGTGGLFRPRVWNGIIHYFVPTPDSTLNSRGSYTGGSSHGVMFDVVANSDVLLRDRLDLELTAGVHDVDVYFRRGSFVGHETSVDGWERIGSTTVTSLGNGMVTSIPLIDQIFMSAGETIALYVDTGVFLAGLRTDAGGSVGDTAVSTSDLTMQVGVATGGLFGPAINPAKLRGVIAYPVCVVQP